MRTGGAQRLLVTDSETRAIVATCRGLKAGGFAVTAVAGARPAPAHWSRAPDRRVTLPHPLTDRDGFIDGLEALLRDEPHALAIPGSDASLMAVSASRERLEPYALLRLPPHDVVLRGLNKLQLEHAAASVGLDSPETRVCIDVAGALAAAEELGYPILLKPAQSVYTVNGEARRSGSVLVADAEQLAELAPAYGEPVLLQRRVAGPLVSFAGVIADGRLLGTAVSVYRRTWRPETGNVAFSTSIAPPEGLSELVLRLMTELNWEGMFELELIDRGGGRHFPIDLNPRPYGSLALAIAAGANLPVLWASWALGERPEPAVARAGVHYRWEDADLRHLVWQLRRGNLAAAGAVLRPRRGVVHPHFEPLDPGPLVARGMMLAGVVAKRSQPAPAHRLTDAGEPPAPAPPAPDAPAPAIRPRRAAQSVAIIGAGPYGLSVAAHVRGQGIRTHVFGTALEFWRTQMPAGMLLRSRKRSSHISDPDRELTIDRYEQATGRTVRMPSLRLEEFIDYGRWFQQQVVPDLDPRKVRLLDRAPSGFMLTLEDGDEHFAERVIVAAGLAPFGRRPAPFDTVDSERVTHTVEHADLSRFGGQRVAVVGAGQSALESAALLHEAGAEVELLIRAESVWWLPDDTLPQPDKRLDFPVPPTDVGGRVTGWLAAAPDAFRRLPRRLQPVVSYRCIRPAGSGWLRPRLAAGVRLTEGRRVMAVECAGAHVRLSLDDESERIVDHVMLGTGFEIDVRQYPFLAPELAADLALADGYPVLRRGLESRSVSGLHFVGAPAAFSFGPIMRFVVGTWYAAPAVARRVAGRLDRPLRLSF